MKTYNKLVRDNIPQVIIKSGKQFKIKLLNDIEYKNELKNKLIEEANELNQTRSRETIIDELADIYEVLDYILRTEKIDLFDVQKRRVQKNMSHGAFDEKIYLEYVKE